MTIASALATLLAVVDRDSKARCTEILDDARAQAAALQADTVAEGRRRLREALRAERGAAAARIAAARTQLAAGQRLAAQHRAIRAMTAAEALLPQALQAAWRNPAQRRRWLAQALARAGQSLPRGAWHIRYAPGPDDADLGFLRQGLAALGIGDAHIETDPDIEAGIEFRVGSAQLDATSQGLLADRAWVYGRLLHLVERP